MKRDSLMSVALAVFILCLAEPSSAQVAPTYADVQTLPCRIFVGLIGTRMYGFAQDPIADHLSNMGRFGEKFGSACNMGSYVEVVCRKHPEFTVGMAVTDLVTLAKSNRLPPIPQCGA